MKDEDGNLKDVNLVDGLYVMIVNKWPEPFNFKVEAEALKESWTQTYLRYIRGIPEPEGKRRRLEECDEPPCEEAEDDGEAEDEADGEEEADGEDGSAEDGLLDEDEEEEEAYQDLIYFLIVMGI